MQMKSKKECRVCMEWQEHCYWTHMADEEKHFFKHMLGDFTHAMSIPDKFANNFNGQISEVINLKAPNAKTFNIGVTNNTDGLVLRSGWKEFVAAHSIEEGDLLLFRYSGISSFDVLIFDSSGCEKILPPFVKKRGSERPESSVRFAQVQHGCTTGNNTRACTLRSPPSDVNAHLEMALQRTTSKSLSDARLINLDLDIRRNLDCWAEQVQCEAKDDDDLDLLDESDSPAKLGYYFCKNGPVTEYHLTEEDKEKISRIPALVGSSNPVFVKVMHPGHVRGRCPSLIGVPPDFATKYLRAIGKDIVLQRSSKGRKWRVHFMNRGYWRGLHGRSWCDFVRHNGLRKGDVCLFELMKDKKHLTLTIHILRRVHGRFILLR